MALPKREKIAGEWLSQREVANRLNAHINTVRNWRKQGLLKAIRLPGGQWRIHRESLDAMGAQDEPAPAIYGSRLNSSTGDAA